ncbi:uncharacterized protein LOC123870498 [Maniola jurtina]|uniref:uncharacterized protein LOC123870498 n=1 Tax=Maniola jurtina TaxID=191418 RepID=UPI001E68675E|nr:uncharacterized protein LOC123870498 [Maniola jurtina]
MPRGKQLSDIEKQRIIYLRSCGKTQRQIAHIIGRSQSVVKNFLKLGIENYGKSKRSGRPPKFSSTVKRAILRELSNTGASSSALVHRYNLDCDPSLIRKWAKASGYLKYRKYLSKPALKEHHIADRLKFADKYLKKGQDFWQHVIFCDEKKFNFDGPDGFKYYWHDLRHDTKIMSRRTRGGGSVMVWGGITGHLKTELAFCNSRMNAAKYQDLLHDYLLPFITLTEDENIIFQQDNAPIHVAKSTKKWLYDFGISTLQWPACSPDLNPMENVWGILARKVYDREKPPINDIQQLKQRLQSSWSEVSHTVIKKLIDSVPNRLIDVIKNKGKWTKY